KVEAGVNGDSIEENSFVDCDVDLGTGPIEGAFKAKVKGNKRQFSVILTKEQEGKFSISIELLIAYVNKNWQGTGYVNGWITENIGKTGSVRAEVRERVQF
ncbi:MAG: hypothetical protein M9962_15745, partial [Oligoflexia bacterium]|nr:hypothetical protein [Oligoflexia bacterium]